MSGMFGHKGERIASPQALSKLENSHNTISRRCVPGTQAAAARRGTMTETLASPPPPHPPPTKTKMASDRFLLLVSVYVHVRGREGTTASFVRCPSGAA